MHQNQTKLNKLIAVLTPTIQPGQVIELTGLKSSLYNGQFGSIVASPNYDDLEQRYSVKLYSSQKTIKIKSINIKAILASQQVPIKRSLKRGDKVMIFNTLSAHNHKVGEIVTKHPSGKHSLLLEGKKVLCPETKLLLLKYGNCKALQNDEFNLRESKRTKNLRYRKEEALSTFLKTVINVPACYIISGQNDPLPESVKEQSICIDPYIKNKIVEPDRTRPLPIAIQDLEELIQLAPSSYDQKDSILWNILTAQKSQKMILEILQSAISISKRRIYIFRDSEYSSDLRLELLKQQDKANTTFALPVIKNKKDQKGNITEFSNRIYMIKNEYRRFIKTVLPENIENTEDLIEKSAFLEYENIQDIIKRIPFISPNQILDKSINPNEIFDELISSFLEKNGFIKVDEKKLLLDKGGQGSQGYEFNALIFEKP